MFDYAIRRIIDANANRAREALRVMEEYARFALDDKSLSAELKQCRHELARLVPPEDARALARAREVEHDVGRQLESDGEYERRHAFDVAAVAAKRLSEAFRAIEEYAKTFDQALARKVETFRYRAYELERRMMIGADSMVRLGRVRLYVIITESLCGGPWLAVARAALRGGADALQLREKHLPDRELVSRARTLVRLCREFEAICFINDRPDVAALVQADGVHVGQEDLSVREARRILPPSALVGVSTHNVPQIEAALAEAPDYLAVGPIFASATKVGGDPVGPQLLQAARKRTSLPLVAIGGITPANVAAVVGAVSCAVCICSSIVGAADVEASCRRLREQINASRWNNDQNQIFPNEDAAGPG